MNATIAVTGLLDVDGMKVQLLDEVELRAVSGGGYFAAGCLIFGALGAAAVIGVAVGVAVYLLTH